MAVAPGQVCWKSQPVVQRGSMFMAFCRQASVTCRTAAGITHGDACENGSDVTSVQGAFGTRRVGENPGFLNV